MSAPSITLISVNVGKPERLADNRPTPTGINKRPTSSAIAVGPLGIQGDAICNLKHHGGVDQAIYFYSQTDYVWWATEHDVPSAPGLFGENLTVEGPSSAEVCIGDRFRIGEVLLETTSPRIPCNTLNRRLNDPRFGQTFRGAERPGWYCRVLSNGLIRNEDPVVMEPFTGERISMQDAMRDYYLRSRVPLTQAARYLKTPAHQKTLVLMQQIIDRNDR